MNIGQQELIFIQSRRIRVCKTVAPTRKSPQGAAWFVLAISPRRLIVYETISVTMNDPCVSQKTIKYNTNNKLIRNGGRYQDSESVQRWTTA
jgi:hypothetical protein